MSGFSQAQLAMLKLELSGALGAAVVDHGEDDTGPPRRVVFADGSLLEVRPAQ